MSARCRRRVRPARACWSVAVRGAPPDQARLDRLVGVGAAGFGEQLRRLAGRLFGVHGDAEIGPQGGELGADPTFVDAQRPDFGGAAAAGGGEVEAVIGVVVGQLGHEHLGLDDVDLGDDRPVVEQVGPDVDADGQLADFGEGRIGLRPVGWLGDYDVVGGDGGDPSGADVQSADGDGATDGGRSVGRDDAFQERAGENPGRDDKHHQESGNRNEPDEAGTFLHPPK